MVVDDSIPTPGTPQESDGYGVTRSALIVLRDDGVLSIAWSSPFPLPSFTVFQFPKRAASLLSSAALAPLKNLRSYGDGNAECHRCCARGAHDAGHHACGIEE